MPRARSAPRGMTTGCPWMPCCKVRMSSACTARSPPHPPSHRGAGAGPDGKPGALLINVGRGGLVDEQALLKPLGNGRLGGAGFDVASIEPPPPDHPRPDAGPSPFTPNFILT